MGITNGWLFPKENNVPGKLIYWSEVYILPQVGYLKIADDLENRYISLSVGLFFGFSKSTNISNAAIRNWYMINEVSTRKEVLYPGPKRVISVF